MKDKLILISAFIIALALIWWFVGGTGLQIFNGLEIGLNLPEKADMSKVSFKGLNTLTGVAY